MRILGTLENLGYARKVGRRVGYTLTGKVAELSAGYHGFPAIHGHASDVLAGLTGLTGRLLWPAALATLDDGAMVVRLSTIPLSPLADAESTLGKRLALPSSAHGRAWLAFCPGEERRRLLALLAANGGSPPGAAGLADWLGPMLRRDRDRGYAVRDSRTEPMSDPGTTTVAVPVVAGGRIVSTVGMTCFSGERTNRNLLARELKAAAARIAAPEYDPLDGEPPEGGQGSGPWVS